MVVLVILGGRRQVWLLWESSNSLIVVATCPLKIPVITRAGHSQPSCWWVLSTYTVRVDDILYILNHHFFCASMFRGMHYTCMSVQWESIWWMAMACLAFVNYLNSEEDSQPVSAKHHCQLALIIGTFLFHMLGTTQSQSPRGTGRNFYASLVPI